MKLWRKQLQFYQKKPLERKNGILFVGINLHAEGTEK